MLGFCPNHEDYAMATSQIIQFELGNYLILADQLKAQFADIDEETLHDTLEGISELPDVLHAIIRSSLEDAIFISGLKDRLEQMQERLARLRVRQEKKRALVSTAMTAAGITRLQAPDFTVSIRPGAQSVEVTDEGLIPGEFYIHQAPRLDRQGLAAALKRGCPIAGAKLVTAEPTIAVRVR
jgi:hypothetical protein